MALTARRRTQGHGQGRHSVCGAESSEKLELAGRQAHGVLGTMPRAHARASSAGSRAAAKGVMALTDDTEALAGDCVVRFDCDGHQRSPPRGV